MSDDARTVLGRRKLLVLGAGAAAIPACSSPNGYPSFDPGLASGDAGSGSSSTSSSGGTTNGGPSSGSSSSQTSSASSSGTGGSSGGGDDAGGSSGDDAGGSIGDDAGGSGSSGASSSGGSSSGGPTCSTSGKIFTLSFSKYPKLMSPGGSYTVSATGYSDPNCHSSQIIVTCQAAGKYVAVSSGCSHQCCAVNFVSVSSGYKCPCHGATFDITGKSTSFIAPKALASLSVCSDATGVYVTIG